MGVEGEGGGGGGRKLEGVMEAAEEGGGGGEAMTTAVAAMRGMIKEMGQWAFTYLLGHTLNLLMLGYIAHFSPVSLAEIHNTWRFRTQVDI